MDVCEKVCACGDAAGAQVVDGDLSGVEAAEESSARGLQPECVGTNAGVCLFRAAERSADCVNADQVERVRARIEDGRVSDRQRAGAGAAVGRSVGAVVGRERSLST